MYRLILAPQQMPDTVPTRLLAAWGDGETISYHESNFAKGEVILFGGVNTSIFDPLLEITSNPNVSSFDVMMVS